MKSSLLLCLFCEAVPPINVRLSHELGKATAPFHPIVRGAKALEWAADGQTDTMIHGSANEIIGFRLVNREAACKLIVQKAFDAQFFPAFTLKLENTHTTYKHYSNKAAALRE